MARAALGTFRDANRQVELAYSQSVRALELLLGRYPGAELEARQSLTAAGSPTKEHAFWSAVVSRTLAEAATPRAPPRCASYEFP